MSRDYKNPSQNRWRGGACRCATPRQCSPPGRCTAASALSGLDRQLRAGVGTSRLRVTRPARGVGMDSSRVV